MRAPGWVGDAAVMAATATLSGLTVWGRAGSTAPILLAVDVGAAVVATGLMPLVNRRPAVGTLAVTLLAAVSPAATPQATLGVVYVARELPFRVALQVASAGVTAHAIQGLWQPRGGLSYGWWLALITAAYAALLGWGALWQSNRAILTSLRERARRAETEQERRVAEARTQERNRIAREMHDVLAHRLSLLATYAGAMEYRPDAAPEQLSKAAAVVRNEAHRALDDLRGVITLLRDDADEPAHPPPVLADLSRLLDESRAAGVRVEFEDRLSTPDSIPPALGRTAYRVVQEALTNARRHAPGQPVWVRLAGAPGSAVQIEIRNPAVPRPGQSAGVGLIGLAERVALAGGRLEHGLSGGEFHLRAWLPWPR